MARVVLFIGFLLLIGLVQSCTELKYKFRGAVVDGKVVEVTTAGTTRRGGQQWMVRYQFTTTEGKSLRQGQIVRADAQPYLVGEPISISYLKADPERNLPTAWRSDFWLWVMGLLAGAAAIALSILIKQSVDDARQEAAAERRMKR